MAGGGGDGRSPADLATGDRIAAALLLLTGAAHAALGVGAIAGVDTFEANVDDIERSFATGLFSSLGVWGALMLLLGLGEMLAARAISTGSPNGWLAGQISAFCGLGGAFFTLAIFRLLGALTIPLGLAVHYLLTHHSSRRP
jgi:hypothetical protein